MGAIAGTLSPGPSLVNAGGENGDAAFSESLRSLNKPAEIHHKGWKRILKMGVAHYFRSHAVTARLVRTTPLPALSPVNGERGVGGSSPGEGVTRIELAPIRNVQWTSEKFVEMGGVKTALSGQFSRSRKAYFAVVPDGAPGPAFVSIEDLIDGDAGLLVNGVEYRMTLSPSVFDRLGSKILVRRAADGKEDQVTMRQIFDRVYRHGVPVGAGRKSLRMFYGQDVDDRGENPVEGKQESLAFLLQEGSDYTTFLIPLEAVPTDGTAGEFHLRSGLNLTLRLQSGILEAF